MKNLDPPDDSDPFVKSRWALAFAAVLALAFALQPSDASAQNDIELFPGALVTPVVSGPLLDYSLLIDFDDATLGGGIVVSFDPAIAAFVDFTWDPESSQGHIRLYEIMVIGR